MPATTTDAIGRVYAKALIDLAEKDNQLDSVAEEMADLGALLDSNADLVRLIENPILERTQRSGMVERLFSGKVSDLLYRFLQVVNQKDRLAALPTICAAFEAMMAKKRNQIDVDAYVAKPMDDATAARVSEGLGQSLGKQVNLRQHVNEALIGGLKLRIGDRMIDASVQSQLKRIEQQLIKTGRENARATAASLE